MTTSRTIYTINGDGSLTLDTQDQAEAEALRGMATGEYAAPQTIFCESQTWTKEHASGMGLGWWQTTYKTRHIVDLPAREETEEATCWSHGSYRISRGNDQTYLLHCGERQWALWQRTDGSWVFPTYAPAFVAVAWHDTYLTIAA